jgi:phage gp46-like protein
MIDLKVIEEGNGGDLELVGKDLATITGLQNMIYLAMFGGNVEASTPSERIPSEQDFSWWGNALFMDGEQEVQFNSLTERTLKTTALTSAGRIKIEEAIKKDLECLNSFAITTVSVTLPTPDRVNINIRIQEPPNQQQKEFVFIWDGTKAELQAA